MRVHAVANDADVHGWLDRILHKVSDGWHLWDTTQELDTSAFEATSWISNRGTKGDEIFRLLQASIRQGVWNFSLHNRQINVTNNPSCSNEFNSEEAARLAEMPVIILVENRHSDGLFLKKVVDVLDRTLSRYWNLPGGPVQIDSVGGIGQMPLEISEKKRIVTLITCDLWPSAIAINLALLMQKVMGAQVYNSPNFLYHLDRRSMQIR